MQITIVRATSSPGSLVSLAADITQKRINGDEILTTPAAPKLIKYLLTANHTSIFEHAVMSVLIQGVSRSFLAQITRHRMASYTSASQHYQDYRGYPDIVDEQMADDPTTQDFIARASHVYQQLINLGFPSEEARQILPNSKAVNILWTINTRSLINFLNQRLCKRNVKEMQVFASKLKEVCMEWWPELFVHIGPDCKMKGCCTQGHMQAKVCKPITRCVPNVHVR
jgi:thymidylate synthase (FAD)